MDDPVQTEIEVPATPAPRTAPAGADETGFRFDVLLIAIVIISAIVASNVWLRRRAERDSETSEVNRPEE